MNCFWLLLFVYRGEIRLDLLLSSLINVVAEEQACSLLSLS